MLHSKFSRSGLRMRSNLQIMGAMKFILLAACAVLVSGQGYGTYNILYEKSYEVYFRQNEPFRLSCGVYDDPTEDSKFTWHKNGKPLTLDSLHVVPAHRKDTLVFIDPTDASEGEYQCFAESSIGIATSGILSVRKAYLKEPFRRYVHKVVEGEPLRLECEIPKSYPKPNITWVSQHEFDKDVTYPIMDARITVGGDNALYISSVTKDDVDKHFSYSCMATTPASDTPVRLAVHLINEVSENKNPGPKKLVPQYLSEEKVVAKVGETIFLYCIYGGTPVASPDWFLKGKNINGDGSNLITAHNRSKGRRLLMRFLDVSDSGAYSCVVTDTDGTKKTHIINLEVQNVLEFSHKPNSITNLKQGQEAVVSCEAEAKPAAKIHWTYNTKPLAEGGKVKITTTTKDLKTMSELRISNFQKADQGYYNCFAVGGDKKETIFYPSLLRLE